MQGCLWSIMAGCCLMGQVYGGGLTQPAPPAADQEVKMQADTNGTRSAELSETEKQTLLAIARDTLHWCVHKRTGEFPLEKYALTPALRVPTATFVTLKSKGQLRGCIGSLEPEEELYLSVHRNTINAATRDYRFPAVQPVELPQLTLDISILSPTRPLATAEEFLPGRMGIILEKAGRRAVFLPEVALEQGWTRAQTLTHLSRKAGLPADAWQKGARFKAFTSTILSTTAH